jgi:hypothetical protein
MKAHLSVGKLDHFSMGCRFRKTLAAINARGWVVFDNTKAAANGCGFGFLDEMP